MSTEAVKKSVCFDTNVMDNKPSNEDFNMRQKRSGSIFLKMNDLTTEQKLGLFFVQSMIKFFHLIKFI